MDLNTISEVKRPASEAELPPQWHEHAMWLAGGTWIYSEPQEDLNQLVDLARLGWDEAVANEQGLTLGAMCTIAKLDQLKTPDDWTAAPLIGVCCRALLASFKIWNEATVGGNICRALPAAGMVTLACALDGKVELWPRQGEPRTLKVEDLVIDDGIAELSPGELMRQLFIPAAALRRRVIVRRAAYAEHSRSMIFLVATIDPDNNAFQLTVTASTTRPFVFRFPQAPSFTELKQAIEERIGLGDYVVDSYRTLAYRRHMTLHFAREICEELSQ